MNTDKRTDDELNRIIAEWCGWASFREVAGIGIIGIAPGPTARDWTDIPNYCREVDSVIEACNKLKDWPDTSPESEQRMFVRALSKVVFSVITCTQNDFLIINATARHRAEALVKVIEEGKK